MTKEAAEELLLLRAEWDWEKFRREATKDILCAVASGAVAAGATGITKDIDIAVRESIKIADELIKQLKEK